jgi:hypothetical protein
VDPCRLLNFDRHRIDESGFRLQRAWSNRLADSGGDPCAPSVRDRPYVALVPRTPVVRLDAEDATASITLDAASDRPVESWTVSAIDLTGEQEGRQYVEARLDKTSVASGDVAVLTIRVVRLHPRQISIVGLVSSVGAHAHLWLSRSACGETGGRRGGISDFRFQIGAAESWLHGQPFKVSPILNLKSAILNIGYAGYCRD